MAEKLEWEIYVPIFKNRFILRDLGLAVGVPFAAVIGVILFAARGDVFGSDAKYALGLIGLLFVLTFILVMLVYGGKYAPGFIIDEHGITNYTQPAQAKGNRVINSLLIAAGLFSGSPGTAGAGLLAQSRQVTRLKWSRVQNVQYHPAQRVIVVRGGPAEKIVVFCSEENYAAVEAMVRRQVGG